MAFNKKNLYKRIIDVQEVVLPELERGVPLSVIYRRHIQHRFRISQRTFETYLGIPAKKRLREQNEREQKNKQATLFDDL